MLRRIPSQSFGFALAEIIVFLAIIAFLAAIVIPGAIRTRNHHRSQRLGSEAPTVMAEQWAMQDSGEDGVVLLVAPAR